MCAFLTASRGAASLCGRAIPSAASSTISQERRSNWALQIKDRAEFVKRMTADLPDRPAYFAHGVEVNLRGARPLSELAAPMTS
jgi:hydroxyacylglutathione hydrolase